MDNRLLQHHRGGFEMNKLYKWLLYLTNNERKCRDEVKFDIYFWIGMTLALLIAEPVLITQGDYGWAAVILIFYLEAWDQLRHNR